MDSEKMMREAIVELIDVYCDEDDDTGATCERAQTILDVAQVREVMDEEIRSIQDHMLCLFMPVVEEEFFGDCWDDYDMCYQSDDVMFLKDEFWGYEEGDFKKHLEKLCLTYFQIKINSNQTVWDVCEEIKKHLACIDLANTIHDNIAHNQKPSTQRRM